MTEERQVALAKATERLEKADARTNELRSYVNRAGGRATTAARDSIRAVETQRTAAKVSIDDLSKSDDASFERARESADRQLEVLEGYVKRAGQDVEEFK